MITNFYSINILEKNRALSGAPSTGVGQYHSRGTMQNSSTNDRMQVILGMISESEKLSFQMAMERNDAI